ncbi:MAG: SRPBCC family protein [Pseudomonadota bacterium]
MPFTKSEIETLRALMEYEAARTAPPESFPALPDLPAGRYTDPDYYALEQEHVWRKSWLLAAHMDEVPEPGCAMRWDMAGEPVVIVHGRDGEVRAFYNTCAHRGAPVLLEDRAKAPRLVCQYHGWTYDDHGALVGMRDPADFPPDFDRSCRGLKRVGCARYGNTIWVNFDDSAIGLREWLGPIANEWEEFQFSNLRLAARHSFDLSCNWKIALEANTEVYHVKSIHPDTVAPILDDRRNVNTLYPNGHGRMIAPAPGGNTIPSAIALREGLAEIETVGEIARTCTQSYGLFPNFVCPLGPNTVPPLLFWPTGLDTCKIEVWTMAPDWGDGPAPDLWTTGNGDALNQVLLEDTVFGAHIQKAMQSRGFTSVPLSYQEARIYYAHQTMDQVIGAENVPKHLHVPPVIGPDWVYPNDPRVALAMAATS